MLVAKLFKSPLQSKKYRVVFYNAENKEIKHIDFGAKDMSDFTIHKNVERKNRFLSRFKKLIEKNKSNPYSPMTLSHLILWNLSSIRDSFNDYKRRFGFS